MAKETKEDSIDMKEAIQKAMAEIKAEVKAEEKETLDVKSMVKELLAAEKVEAKEIEVKEVKTVAKRVTKSQDFEVKSPKELGTSFYSRSNHGELIGYKSVEIDQAYDDGMFWDAQFNGSEIAKEYCDARGIEVKTMTSTNNAAVIPEQLLNRIIILANSYGIIRRNSTIYTATTSSMDIPKNNADTEASYTAEGIEKTLTTATTQLVEVLIRKLTVASLINMELVQDSVIDMISYVIDNMARALAKKQDTDGFYGDGTVTSGSITGIIPYIEANGSTNDSIVNPATDDGTWASIKAVDFDSMEGQISESAWTAGDVKYYCSNAFAHKVINRVKREGGSSVVEVENGYVMKLNGIPVETTSVLPNSDSANPSEGAEDYCLLGSMKTVSAMAERMGRTVRQTSEGKYTLSNQTLIVSELRWGFTVHDSTGGMVLLQSAAV